MTQFLKFPLRKMEDEDELLHSGQCTDDESLSESEDQCMPPDKPEEIQNLHHIYVDHSKLEFFTIKLLLVFSSTAIVIILPLYLETLNKSSDAYSMLYIDTSFIFFSLLAAVVFTKQFCVKFRNVNVLKPPVSWIKLFILSILYVASAFMIVYAVDRKRVMCHLQDPIKGVILVFSLVNYFFFCKRMMGLQRIFSTTTIIVGLFISVDYGLCDEFRCRGNEREHRSDDAGTWTWQTHSIWAAVYIVGLFLFATFFTLLDRFLVPSGMISPSRTSTQLLTTVSRMVAFQNTSPQMRTITTSSSNKKNVSVLHLAFYIQTAAWILATAFFWTDIIPTVGKGGNTTQLLTNFKNGLECHFAHELSSNSCQYATLYGWLFIVAYLTFFLCSLRFLILCQSAVYTLSIATSSLPLVGIWWSLFKMNLTEIGMLIWAPSVTGELICALLGLPIVIIGLTLLCKSHFKDCKLSKMTPSCLTSTQLA